MQPIPSVPGQAPLISTQQPFIPPVPQVQAIQAFSPKVPSRVELSKDRQRRADEKADEQSSERESQPKLHLRSWDFADFLPVSTKFLAQFLAQHDDTSSPHHPVSLAQAIALYKRINNWARSENTPIDPRRPILFRRSDGSRVTAAI